MKELSSYIFNFEEMIKGGFLYVDKTEYLWNLIRPSAAGYFLSRPRRFGKSLTVSTLKCIFEGKKELFKGLSIYEKDYDWKKYPIINLSLADLSANSTSASTVAEDLNIHISRIAREYDIQLYEIQPDKRFSELIDILYQKAGAVVIFVDEYDKPIINNLDNPKVEEILKELKAFYSVLKTQNAKIRFLFVTGITKFSHVSIFSDLNNLTDLTMNPKTATMLGYTQKELETNFSEYIDEASKKHNCSREELIQHLKDWYDGYCFREDTETVYNPVSIAHYFTNDYIFENYWSKTAIPSFLTKLAKEQCFDIEDSLKESVGELTLSAFEVGRLSVITLMFQTGYLTIKSCDRSFEEADYYLGFPNNEVKASFERQLLSAYIDNLEIDVRNIQVNLLRALKKCDIDMFMNTLITLFAAIQYDEGSKYEARYQIIFHTVLAMIGANIKSEERTNNGRIDAVVTNKDYIYIFEFKVDQPATKALEQIKEKAYFQKYLNQDKRIILIGASFDTKIRQISDYTFCDL